jgi:hypothetical protein
MPTIYSDARLTGGREKKSQVLSSRLLELEAVFWQHMDRAVCSATRRDAGQGKGKGRAMQMQCKAKTVFACFFGGSCWPAAVLATPLLASSRSASAIAACDGEHNQSSLDGEEDFAR